MEVILCDLLFMKRCMFCKYTPAALKKELKNQEFFDLPFMSTYIHFLFPANQVNPVNRGSI